MEIMKIKKITKTIIKVKNTILKKENLRNKV